MKKILLYGILVTLLFPGCCIFRKTRTVETISRIDTVIIVRVDTLERVVSVPVYDTAYIETTTGNAISYIDTTMKKLVLKFTGHSFAVPVQMYQTTIRTEEIKKPDKPRKPITNFQIMIGLILAGFMLYLIKK